MDLYAALRYSARERIALDRRWRGPAGRHRGSPLASSRCARFDLVNIAMAYLLAVVLRAARAGGRRPPPALCVAAFDFLFVPPRGAFTVDDLQYLLTFAIMVTVA